MQKKAKIHKSTKVNMRVNEKAVSGSETEEHAHAQMTSGAAGAQQPAQYPDVHMPFEPGMYHVMPNAVSLQLHLHLI